MTALQTRILALLEEQPGRFVSGARMAEELRVSRTAIMKAVAALQNDGYTITAARRLGYRLDRLPEKLDATVIRNDLQRRGLDVEILVFQTIDSTNNEGKKRTHDLQTPTLLLAEEQTQGRGRQGRSFYSPPGTGLYMSIVAPTRLALTDAALCTQLMAVAAARAVDALGGPTLQVKWVNDLYLHGRKTAGILTEAITDLETGSLTAVVCGIGLNLTTEAFPDGIMDIAGSMGQLNRNELAAAITFHFLTMMKELPDTTAWLDEYRSRSLVLNHALRFAKDGREYHGTGKEIDDQGRLVVSLEDGSEVTLSSGEVSVRPDPV